MFDSKFLLGVATAAHQVEGNNIHSDCWAQEQMKNSPFKEPSLDACDHYNRFKEDIALMKEAGYNAYRFSIEWARIEPVKGQYDEKEIAHYRDVILCCKENGIEPIVTMHHFSSPKWLITLGGWEAESTIEYFKNYCLYVIEKIGDLVTYVCTINEANMGVQIAAIVKQFMKQAGLQVGLSMPAPEAQKEMMLETMQVFEVADPTKIHTFLSMRTPEGDKIIAKAHEAARDAMKVVCPHLKIGLTLSLHDIQVADSSHEAAALAQEEWETEFEHYLPAIKNDDFIGVQNYTREIFRADGVQKAPEGAELTQMDYEFYPKALGNVIRKVAEKFKGDIIVTENGVATTDDTRRVAFIDKALVGVKACMDEGIPVKGYLYWSLMDNFEWQKGFSMHFGLIEVDRATQNRYPRPSLYALGNYLCK